MILFSCSQAAQTVRDNLYISMANYFNNGVYIALTDCLPIIPTEISLNLQGLYTQITFMVPINWRICNDNKTDISGIGK